MCTDDLQLNLLPEKTCLKSKSYCLLFAPNLLYPLFIGRSCGNIAAHSFSSLLPKSSQVSHNNFSSEPHTSHLLFRHTSKFSSRLGRVNENNVARSKNCCGWPSSPHERLVSYSLFTNTYTCKLGIFPYLENSYFSMFTKSEFSPS